MLRVTSIKPKVIPALILGASQKGMASSKKTSLPSEVYLVKATNRNSSDIVNAKLAKVDCGSVEVFCSVGLSF